MASVLGFVMFLVNSALLGVVSRRLLGVPVGWPRTVLVSAVILTSGSTVLSALSQELGLLSSNGQILRDDESIVALVLALMLGWTIALGLAVLVVLETLVPTGSLGSPVAAVRGLRARRRRTSRYAAILGIAVRNGLGRFLGRGSRLDGNVAVPTVARSLRVAMTEGGVTFVKLGQMLASRPDLVGEEFARELSLLQADVQPEPWDAVRRTLQTELPRPIEQVFQDIDPIPMAAASVGQVHGAHLADGSAVVVKVQRSDARRQVTADLDIVRRLARTLERRTSWGRALGLRGLAHGFAVSLDEELDYRTEAANARAVAATLGDTPLVAVPAVIEDVSGPRVLVMERVEGVPVSRAVAELQDLPAERRVELSRALLAVVLRQVVDSGVFHADLHGGNVLLRPSGRLCLLDFGSVGRLDSSGRDGIARLLAAVDRADSVAATDALIGVLDRPAVLDDRALEREVGALIGRFRHGGAGLAGASGMFAELFSMVVRHGFSVPGQVAAVFRTLGSLEGTLRRLDPGLDLVDAARDVGRELFVDRLAPHRLRASAEEQLAQLLPVLQRLPRRLDALADAAQGGRLSVRVRVLADPDDRAFVTGLVQQMTMSVIAGALSLSAVLLILARGGPMLADGVRLFPLLGATLLLFGFVIAARVLALAFRSRAPLG